ncbi:Enriched in surface-labeled proteome protein 11 [Novymonas esmeraldas]|uniref:Enriched in surface-labeled proteome protein 11 n=1 Tax=Novymonas esmeraldas TaxID=1808958 RepID=A0AAW0F3K1_9TRYP
MTANLVGVARVWRRAATSVVLFLLVLSALSPSSPSVERGGDLASAAALLLGPRVRVARAAQLRECPQLQDLGDYGVNLNLFDPNSVYLNGAYFCAKSAPAQYHCRCSVATTCKKMSDPWGRNIGSCDCCPPWMIVCFVVLGIFFVICVLGAVYVVTCQGRWWCDGYASPKASLMPRRGPAVSCPPTRPFPQNLFRGYTSSDFVNAEATPGASLSAGGASVLTPVRSPNLSSVANNDLGLLADTESTSARAHHHHQQQQLHQQQNLLLPVDSHRTFLLAGAASPASSSGAHPAPHP